MGEASTTTVNDELLLKTFFAEVGEVERDNDVARFVSVTTKSPETLVKMLLEPTLPPTSLLGNATLLLKSLMIILLVMDINYFVK